MNIRQTLGFNEPYARFNREERNLVAIFFHAVNLGDNLARFLEAAGCRPCGPDWSPEVYFEFAYLRDLWHRLDDNVKKRQLILACLGETGADLASCSIEAFNRHFGAVPRPSVRHIQSPSNWSLTRFAANIDDNARLLAACRLKWAFNAKPDLVMRTDATRWVCIEAKLESGEGRYPSSSGEKKIFAARGMDRVSQTEIQRYAMQDLLGFDTEFLLLAKTRPRSCEHAFISWRDAFTTMDLASLPAYMTQTIESMAGPRASMTLQAARQFLSTLAFRADVRRDPDEPRQREFRRGFKAATTRDYAQSTLRTLTWNNLGYRAQNAGLDCESALAALVALFEAER